MFKIANILGNVIGNGDVSVSYTVDENLSIPLSKIFKDAVLLKYIKIIINS